MYESVHVLHLVISRLLKECLVHMVNDNEKTTFEVKLRGGIPKTNEHISIRILQKLNTIVEKLGQYLWGFQKNVNVSKRGSSHNLQGLFCEGLLIGMVTAFNLKKHSSNMPLLEAIVDRFCANEATAAITKVFTKYSDLLLTLNRKRLNLCWKVNSWKNSKTTLQQSIVSTFE